MTGGFVKIDIFWVYNSAVKVTNVLIVSFCPWHDTSCSQEIKNHVQYHKCGGGWRPGSGVGGRRPSSFFFRFVLFCFVLSRDFVSSLWNASLKVTTSTRKTLLYNVKRNSFHIKVPCDKMLFTL